MISHIVLFEPRAGLTQPEVLLFAQQFSATMRSIPSVMRGQIGRRVAIDSGEARNFGDNTYQFAAVLEFADADALIAYLRHPLHRELGRLFWEFCGAAVVMEVESVDVRGNQVSDLLVKTQI